ncbi:TetR family transcriptional regulator [Prauserella marina]|uniref:DNA-binding transcriptional regulator, AcrR family n=1 Tax=Prauserella marina TaxID=530584 RepID=A0A222VQN6_9PSEU|nr:TetR/AcrR family transcriptional regulator [Prauserella marina]ASR36162.1 TetR family transcriptional regulator [Prauserella marina]PWV76911.1 TetR family transcriptional regulator [Prauserella marina]SDD00226.1 DNA-binding transcriptional regulator, AcrR family [Prauserella marina]
MKHGVRAEQREQTRRTLLAQGRRLFAEKGYADVGLAEIVAAAGVTKGAFYHHFDSKLALFRGVLTAVQEQVGAEVAAAADAEKDPWRQLVTGCLTFLTATAAPDVQRVMLVDGPAVLGWAEWRALDEASSARHLAEALEVLIGSGVLARQPVAPLTHLLSGAMNEAALWLAGSAGNTDLDDTKAALTRMLTALRADNGVR